MSIDRYNFLILIVLIFTFTACNKNTSAIPEIPHGAMVLLDEVKVGLFDAADLTNTAYQGVLRDPVGNVASLEIYAVITRSTNAGLLYSERTFIKSLNNVNGAFSISATEVAASVGTLIDTVTAPGTTTKIPLTTGTDLKEGDRIDFVNQLTTKDGKLVQLSDISQNLNGSVGQKSAFDFTVFVACSITAAFTGDYTLKVTGPGAGWLSINEADSRGNPNVFAFTHVDDITRSFTYTFLDERFKNRVLEIKLLCGKVVVLLQSTETGCGTILSLTTNPNKSGTYNETDDSSFTVELLIPANSSCDIDDQLITLTFTKQ